MAHTPRRRKRKRRRTVPRKIGEKTEREIMETVLGKRVLEEADRVLAEYDGTTDRTSI